jgi:PAS domain S-box-containing protein
MPVSPFKSLRVRLITGVVIIEIVMLSLLVWSNLSVIRQAYADRLRDTASGLLDHVAATAGSYLLEVDYASLEEYLRSLAQQESLAYLTVLDRDQTPVVSIGSPPLEHWPQTDVHPLEVRDGVLDLSDDILIGSQVLGAVHAGFSLTPMQQAINSARLRSVAIAGTEIVLTIFATVFIGVHLTRRLGRLAAAAQRVGSGDYSVTVPAELDDEVGMTATAFNRMVGEVSQRTRRLEETLARERVIEETAVDGMITYNADTRIVSVNPAMQQLFAYPPDFLHGKKTALLLAPLTDRDATAFDTAFWTRPTTGLVEVTGRRRDGSCFPLELHIGRVALDGEALFAATLHDVTARKQAESECRNLLEGNRFLIHKSLAVQEEERRHLARELHDELGQCVTAIQADAELIHELSRQKDPAVATSAQAIVAVSSRMYDVVHNMMQRLRPGVLDDLGLVAALEEEIEAWQGRHPRVTCHFDHHGELMGLGEPVNISLYRIVQESLTNIAKHAEATQVDVRLKHDGSKVSLEIRDNGCGMDSAKPGRGLGLIGMRERAEALGGTLVVASGPERGTTITVGIPLS